MIGEIISIGDELTSGQRLDTNSQWLSERLGELGVRVMYHTTVADDLEANQRVFSQAADRANIVVATGGLGPTADDLTREVLATVAGVELVLDEALLEHIRGLFARHKREMPERNRLQALFPASSRPIFNPRGTAPGIDLEIKRPTGGGCRIFALPGVPAEMFEMFHQSVAPAVSQLLGKPHVIRHRRIKCFGVGESHLEQMLPDLIRRGRSPAVGITVHAATITLRITAEGDTPEACQAAMQPTADTIYQCLGTLIFGEEDDELDNSVLGLLAQRGQTLATVEFGTQGVLAHGLSEATAAGQFSGNGQKDFALVGKTAYRGGIVAGAAAELPAPLVAVQRSAVNESPSKGDLVGALAAGCREQFGADYGLAVGPFPPAVADAEAPEYFFALATPSGVRVQSSTLASHPSIWKPRAAKQALNLLRLELLGNGVPH